MTKPVQDFLPYGRQEIDEDDIAAVAEVLRGDFLTTGPAVEAFEAALCDATAAPRAVVCSSGTAALHLAALALDLAPGDRVIVPSETFAGTANAVRYVGGEVVFADCDPETGLMGPAQFEAALARAAEGAGGSGRLRAVFPVHLAGQAAPPAEIAAIAKRHDLVVVEDACHALGSYYQDAQGAEVPIGACRHSTMAVFSFHPVKTIAMGEGGAVTTGDSVLADRLRRLRSHGIERTPANFSQRDLALDAAGNPNPWYHEIAEFGFNYRASDIHCALGRSQLAKLPRFIGRRRELVARYDEQLEALAPLLRPLGRSPGCTAAWHLYVVLIDFPALGYDRAAVMHHLHAQGIGSQVHYIPVHRQPYYQARYGAIDLPGADSYYARCLSLPLFPAMADRDVDRVVDALSGIVETSQP